MIGSSLCARVRLAASSSRGVEHAGLGVRVLLLVLRLEDMFVAVTIGVEFDEEGFDRLLDEEPLVLVLEAGLGWSGKRLGYVTTLIRSTSSRLLLLLLLLSLL